MPVLDESILDNGTRPFILNEKCYDRVALIEDHDGLYTWLIDEQREIYEKIVPIVDDQNAEYSSYMDTEGSKNPFLIENVVL